MAHPPVLLERVELPGRQHLLLEHRTETSLVRIIGPDGRARLTIEVTGEGPVLRLTGTGLRIEADGDLSIVADRLAIHGREEVLLSTGGDMTLKARGDLQSTARIQNITAELGNVNVKANDDVKLNGERVRVNC